jgi:ribosomal protein S18
MMDSGRTEDLLQQYITEMQNVQEERRTGREQEHQNDTERG